MMMPLLRSSLRVVIASSSSFNSSVSSSKTPKIRLMTSEKTLDTKEERRHYSRQKSSSSGPITPRLPTRKKSPG